MPALKGRVGAEGRRSCKDKGLALFGEIKTGDSSTHKSQMLQVTVSKNKLLHVPVDNPTLDMPVKELKR